MSVSDNTLLLPIAIKMRGRLTSFYLAEAMFTFKFLNFFIISIQDEFVLGCMQDEVLVERLSEQPDNNVDIKH